MPLLELKEISYSHGKHLVVDRLSLKLEPGEIGCLLGPSGCGKTTVLRCIAGFEHVSDGEIFLAGRLIGSARTHVPAEQRRIGMVFQDYALFPHLSVADNIGFGLRDASADMRRARVAELLATVGLAGQDRKYPHELSGGQQQRVALARALAPRPRLLLLDEPFSNLDVDLRERLAIEVRDILKAEGTTAILVTHDQHEAFALADQIGVMHEGRIQQWDAPYELYHRPVNRFVADFIGQGVFLSGTLVSPEAVETDVGIIRGDRAYLWPVGSKVDVLLRPDDVVADADSTLRGEVAHKAFKGASIMYTLKLSSGNKVLALFPSHHDHPIGEEVGIRIDADHLISFLSQGEGPGRVGNV